jgi:hypothetical protein
MAENFQLLLVFSNSNLPDMKRNPRKLVKVTFLSLHEGHNVSLIFLGC